jgi:signal transduction histidine kinase
MRISRILRLSTLAIVASLLLVATSMVGIFIMDERHAASTRMLNTVVRKISIIRAQLPTNAGAATSQSGRQWRTVHAELSELLAALPTHDAATQAISARVRQEHGAVGALFERLSSAQESGDGIEQETVEMIGGQLDVRTASMVADVLALNDTVNDSITRQKETMLLLIGLWVSVLAGVSMILLLVLQRRVARPIEALERATVQLSDGRLDQPVSVLGSDEVASLARSFEFMRVSLKARLRELDVAHRTIEQENERLARRVDERTAELVAANEELQSFAYAVSHDLRAPLRAMSGFSQALMEDHGSRLDGEALSFLDQIVDASVRMGHLIDGLLVLSRATRADLSRDEVDLTSLARRLLSEHQHIEPERAVDWHVDDGLKVKGDARMVEVMMRNLIGNAWKYTARTERAEIRIAAAPDGWSICVSDNGAGFDMSHAAKLFQPFQRLHRQDEFAGMGIGLATVERIVKRHGGQIDAWGEPGRGARICFSLAPASRVTAPISGGK